MQCAETGLDLDRIRAALVVSTRTSGRLAGFNDALRQFDHGGTWPGVLAAATKAKHRDLSLFAGHIHRAWPTAGGPGDADLVALARLFRITIVADQDGGAAWQASAAALGRALFDDDKAGAAGMEALRSLARRAIQSGAPIDRAGALRALRDQGLVDRRAPGYDADIAALTTFSAGERQRLRRHTVLPLPDSGDIAIERACLAPLIAAVATGSFLVTGEPGAGKTGILLHLAQSLTTGPVVFLSVDRFSGVSMRRDLQDEIGLDHDLLEVLANWPGTDPGVLLVDALDASRGGASEMMIRILIDDAVARLGQRWSVIASIRRFDLRHGERFRDIMAGAPPDTQFADPELGRIRHFHLGRLTAPELDSLATTAPALHHLVRDAPDTLSALLHTMFNLSMAAELLSSGMAASDITHLATQSDLLVQYEDRRLSTLAMKRAAAAVAELLVARRSLTVRDTDVPNTDIEAVLRQGVLVKAGDRIGFAHHVLFDHLAARLVLEPDEPDRLLQQLMTTDAGLMLAPAVRFAVQLGWTPADAGRGSIWTVLVKLPAALSRGEAEPLIVSAAFRSAAEMVRSPGDLAGLTPMLDRSATGGGDVIKMLARCLDVLNREAPLDRDAVLAWSHLAATAAAHATPDLLAAAHMLLTALKDSDHLSDPAVLAAYGSAARTLLRGCWGLSPEIPLLTDAAIRSVTRSFGADPAASHELMQRILTPERLKTHAATDAAALAEGIREIIRHDPPFAIRIYAALFAHAETDETPTWFAGRPSPLLPMTSTPRQDFELARWRLTQDLRCFLETSVTAGTRAAIAAARGLVAESRQHRDDPAPVFDIAVADGTTVTVVGDCLSWTDWREEAMRPADAFTTLVDFLRSARPEDFASVVATARCDETPASIWARIVGVAADRDALAGGLIWPVVSTPEFIAQDVVLKDAVAFLAALYPRTPEGERETFERKALAAADLLPDSRQRDWWLKALDQFLSEIPAAALVTPELRAMRDRRDEAGALTGNPPLMTITTDCGPYEDVVESQLRQQGVDLERSPDRDLRAASRRLEDRVRAKRQHPIDADDIRMLWADVQALVDRLDADTSRGPHESNVHAAWGAVGNAVDAIARADGYAPDQAGHPSPDALLALIARLQDSPYPGGPFDDSEAMAWGNWDVRVCAAASLVALAARPAMPIAAVLDGLATALDDPAPTVRLQVAEHLTVLWDTARDRMWEWIEHLVGTERHPGVLRFFVQGTLDRLKGVEPDRVGALVDRLLRRAWDQPAAGDANGNWATDAAAPLAGWLYAVKNEPLSEAWLRRFAADPARGSAYLQPCLRNLSAIFFFPYRPKTSAAHHVAMAWRARDLLGWILPPANALMGEASDALQADADPDGAWTQRLRAAGRLIDGICDQLYFGSGTFGGGQDDEPGLTAREDKRRFLTDYADILDLIGEAAPAPTVHHLVELYAHLADGDPDAVFGRVARLLQQRGMAADGYRSERLAADVVVRLVRRYLADYRAVFEAPDRQAELVRMLALFADGGSQDAVRLMVALPDLMR